MAANVETMFSVREVPWHGMGTIVQDAPDSERALILAGLNWGVEKAPLLAAYQGRQIPVPDRFATVRMDNGKPLGVVGSKYRILQNRESFSWSDVLLGEAGVRYETAGALGQGEKIWLLARMPEALKVVGDDVTTYLLLSNSHDGSGAVKVAVVPVRVVCQNTLNLALKTALRSWSVRHTGDLRGKITAARKALLLTRNYMSELQARADILATMRISPDAWSEMVQALIPTPEKTDGPRGELVLARVKGQQKALRDRMLVPDLALHRYTAWGAVNAVADYVSHVEPVRKSENWQEQRFSNVTAGDALLDQAAAHLRDQLSVKI